MRKYVVKDHDKKEYRNLFGVTDYDIPMFGLKSSLLIACMTMLSLMICINGLSYMHIDFRIPNAIISGLVCGFSVAYSQFYIERKKGICKDFWIVGSLFSFMAFIVILIMN